MLEIQNLHVKFHNQDREAVSGVSLTIQDGEILGLVGESGSGKSVTAMSVAGLLPRKRCDYTGRILLDGQELLHADRSVLREIQGAEIGVVFQEPQSCMDPLMKIGPQVEETLRIHTQMPKEERYQRALAALAAAELPDPEGICDKYPHELSGGMLQRAMIAAAIVNRPKLLLLDEPLGALDLKLRKDMQVELKKIQKQTGITFVFVTHDQEEALSMSDTVVVMSEGKIQQIGTPIDIYNEPQNAFVADFIGESNILDGIMLEDYKVAFSGQTFPCLDKDFGKNVPVDVVVRPEDVDIVPVEQGQLTGVVTSVTFMGVHYEIIVDVGGFKWMIQTTDFVDVDEHIGIQLEPDAIHIMRKSEYSDLYGDYSSFSNELDELSEAPEEDDE